MNIQERKLKLDGMREAAENDLAYFIKLVAPHRLLGSIHEELISWWTREEAKTNQLTLMPRAHQKSILMAYRVAWWITRNPETTILYISSTANLAEKQLKAIKDILTSKIYKRYWPEMVHPKEGMREKWATGEIAVDHPKRKEEGVRDPTVFTAGLTTGITGMHCDVAVMDDVVVKENAYTEDGRSKVRDQYSLLASIKNTSAYTWIVGTRYDPRDLYEDLKNVEMQLFNDEGEQIGSELIYEIFERVVEDRGDGTGEFLWPRQRRSDGKWFGFDIKQLARIRAEYLDRMQYRAQYYNDPNDPDNAMMTHDNFQYYNNTRLTEQHGNWFYNDRRLNIFAAIDFAFSLRAKADYTSIVVIGLDSDNNIYVLDIKRFKTDKISEYYSNIFVTHAKWGFKKIRAEVTVAQSVIVEDLKENYIKRDGLNLSVDPYRPSRAEGSKEERINTLLQPRYDNMSIWHYKGGNCQSLEEELILARPPHDDIKDALASAVAIAKAPSTRMNKKRERSTVIYHPRFGGVRA